MSTVQSALDIDHLVPLSEAWDSGAYSWTADQRRQFANDDAYEASLGAITDEVNSSKGVKGVGMNGHGHVV